MNTTRVIQGVGIAVVLVACVSVAGWWYVLQQKAAEEQAFYAQNFEEQATDLAEQGKFKESADIAGAGRDTNVKARNVLENSKFMTGEIAERVEAVKLTKATYLNAKTPSERAYTINQLLGFSFAGMEDYVYQEIFKGEPFEKFLDKNDTLRSVVNLAEESLREYPTTAALFRVGAWHAAFVDKGIDGNALDRGATPEEKEEHVDAILAVIKDSAAILAQEKKASETFVFGYMIEARYHFWRAFLYGAAATVRPELLLNQKEEIARLEALYANSRDENGDRIELIKTRTPYAYAGFARFNYMVRGQAGLEETRAYLDKLIALVAENPELHEGAYLSSARSARDGIYNATTPSPHETLARLHEPYRQFLITYGGWDPERLR